MPATEMTLNEIRAKGYEALVRELGPVGYVRFLQQFSAGAGDYTAERRAWADSLSPEQVRELLARQRTGTAK